MGYSNTSYRRIQTIGQPESERLGARKTSSSPTYSVKDRMNKAMPRLSTQQIRSIKMSPKGKLPSFLSKWK